MSTSTFIQLQMKQIKRGRGVVVLRKMKRALQILPLFPLYILALLAILVIRLIQPWLLIRWEVLYSDRIGTFAAYPEMYLCEQDAGINVPQQSHLDLFYMIRPICNQQLSTMWKRVLHVWPFWILAPIARVNRLIPGGDVHEIGVEHGGAKDLYNLLDRFPPHLKFTPEEDARGGAGLMLMGIPKNSPFVCLIVRDSAYLDAHFKNDWNYHNYRDSDIQNYLLAAEELTARSYFVIRMGAKVHKAMKTTHPKIIDYATNCMRNDFMDIYLGAKCSFCISTGLGWDEIPEMFRRPIVYTNYVPPGYFHTFRKEFLNLTKHHILENEIRELTLSEIFTRGVGFSGYTWDYESKGIKLIENTPEEIRDIVIEMVERLNGSWQPHEDDEVLQKRFWKIFLKEAMKTFNGQPFYGEIRALFGAHFLRNNPEWLK